MRKMKTHDVEVLWRVWVLPGAETWKLASGAEMKQNRQARRATLDAERYARLISETLALAEPLEFEIEAQQAEAA